MAVLEKFSDYPTLIAVNIMLHSISALLMLLVYLGMPNARGLFAWMIGNVACAAGFTLMVSDFGPSLARNMGANFLIDMGAMLAYVATVQFLHRPSRDLWLLAPAILMIFVEITWLCLQPNMVVGIFLGCGLRALVTVGVSWQLFRHANAHIRPASNLSAIFHLVWAAMLIGRILWWIVNLSDHFQYEPTSTFAVMFRIALTFVVTPSYLWMVARQLDYKLIEQARQDPLTGIANRRVMWEAGEEGCGPRRNQRRVALLMIDIDHFKLINDRFGHEIGDRVLIRVALTLQNLRRQGDVVARVGGEEFMILLFDSDRQTAFALGERLRHAVEMLEVPVEGVLPLRTTISVGCSLLMEDADSWEELAIAADRGLYRAKHLGRNRVEAAPARGRAVEDARVLTSRAM